MTPRAAVAVLVLLPAVLWKLYQLHKAPRDRSLLAVTVCVLCTAVSFCLRLPTVRSWVDTALGPGTARLVASLLLLDTAYWLLCFYLGADTNRQRARRRTRRQGCVTTLVAVGMTWATLETPGNPHGVLYWTVSPDAPVATVFFALTDLYLVYAFGAALRWTCRFVRMSSRETATGLRLTALSLALMAIAVALRPVAALLSRAHPQILSRTGQAGTALLALALPILAAGLSYPSIVTRLRALRPWWHRRQSYLKLRPLWVALHDAFPENALTRATRGALGEKLCVRSIRRRYYRRVIECRDGLVTVSPYLAMLNVSGTASPEAVARALPEALRSCISDTSGTARAVGLALPDDNSLDADARQLVVVSEALRCQALHATPVVQERPGRRDGLRVRRRLARHARRVEAARRAGPGVVRRP